MSGAYRGWFSLNGQEIANSSRIITHLGKNVPTSDVGMFEPPSMDEFSIEDPPGSGLYIPLTEDPDEDLMHDIPPGVEPDAEGLYPIPLPPCALVESDLYEGLYEIPATSRLVRTGLYTLPDGAERYGPGLYLLDGHCWEPNSGCHGCADVIGYDDSWDGLQDFLDDNIYRPELAPWYTTLLPESSEFLGVWVMKVDGFGPSQVERPITELVGHGGVAGAARDRSRKLTFEAVLLGCTNAGVEYGLDWLACQLRDTNTNVTSVLRYLSASPSYSKVDPDSLARELHGVVLTRAPSVESTMNLGADGEHLQGTLYRVTWEMTALHPYTYYPSVTFPVEWDETARKPVNWVHAADCQKPSTCEAMPVLFSAECIPEEIDKIDTPPPVCGGCLPVGAMDIRSYRVPTFERAFRCRETAVTMRIRNLGTGPLTIQGFWRVCGTDIRCEDWQWPVQISGLPAGTEVVLDGVRQRYWAIYDDRPHRAVGIVQTPNGAPWRPPLIDRQTCWDFIVQSAGGAEFDITMTLSDREP